MARKSRKQTAAPMPAPSLYVHVALYIRLSVEDNKKRGCSVENQKLVLNDFLSDKPDFVVYGTGRGCCPECADDISMGV